MNPAELRGGEIASGVRKMSYFHATVREHRSNPQFWGIYRELFNLADMASTVLGYVAEITVDTLGGLITVRQP